MKTIFTSVAFFVLSLTAQQAFSKPLPGPEGTNNPGKKKEISVGSNRRSGDIQLHFTADRAGDAIITILDESGKIALQQTDHVKNSENVIPLKNVNGLNGGSYIVKLVSNNETYTTRFMIWK